MSKQSRFFKQALKYDNKTQEHPKFCFRREQMTLKSYRQQRRLWGRWQRNDKRESHNQWSRSDTWRYLREDEEE